MNQLFSRPNSSTRGVRSFGRLAAAVALISILMCPPAPGQSENVPADHPVYTFLKRMEVKGLIERYHDAVLPLSRREVAGFLETLIGREVSLTPAERGWLEDFLSEFQYDRTGSVEGLYSLIDSGEPNTGAALAATFSNREKFLSIVTDSNIAFFLNGLVDADGRRITGDDLGTTGSTYGQIGFRARGSVLNNLGYYLQWTNAQFWGSRALLQRDPRISQSYELTVPNAQNFDFVDGYLRYDARYVSAEVGRERVLWGTGYDEKLTLSGNVRVFDFIRLDAQYKSFKYTFLHGWLLGSGKLMPFMLSTDTSTVFVEPVYADKYFAAHRIEFSFPRLFDIGAQEMVVYSNRSPDLAYLNPLTVFESAQRSRGERDNVFWAFDVQTHLLKDMELSASMLFDDINLPDLFTNTWSDRYAWQAGMMYVDAFSIPNTSLMVEYLRIEPYVFSHGRSRDDTYTSLGTLLGPSIGPNADSWFIRWDILPRRNLILSVRVNFERKGQNVVDSTGSVVRNVGGDVFLPHRNSDPEVKEFLDGTLVKSRRLQLQATWECVNQIWVDAGFAFESVETVSTGLRSENHLAFLHLKMEF